MLDPIFWNKVQGQNHPGRWEIAEHQIHSIKVLFKTNTKGHEHHSIRLFIREQDAIGKPKKTKSGIQPRNHTLPREIQSYRMWWGAASPILNDTPVVCIHTSYNRTHIFLFLHFVDFQIFSKVLGLIFLLQCINAADLFYQQIGSYRK